MRKFSMGFGVTVVVGAWLTGCQPATTTPTSTWTAKPTRSDFTEIHWYVGYGLGSDSKQHKAEQAAVDSFNKTIGAEQGIRLVLDAAVTGTGQSDLRSRIVSGNGPDIVGPVSWPDANMFNDEWLDIQPYLEASGFNTGVFDSALVDMYKVEETRVGLPFIVSPSVVFYNPGLFNDKGLAYPPDRYGVQYTMPDGAQVDWSWDALAALAKLLTLDGAGVNATEPLFDKEDIRQYGFTWQGGNHPNYWGSYWAGGSMVDVNGKTAKAPEAWKEAWRWTYNAIWGSQPYLGSADAEGGPDFANGKPFNSQKAAMAVMPFSNACCTGEIKHWELAVLPSYDGNVTGRMEEASFRIWKGTQHPQQAMAVLQYLVTTAVDALVIGSTETPAPYKGIPALTSAQEKWKSQAAAEYPWVLNWDAVLESMAYPDLPSAEEYMPNYAQAWARGVLFAEKLRTTDGLDLDKEIETYAADLTDIFAR
jgi:multiple sugar transport system substrate-binding protein